MFMRKLFTFAVLVLATPAVAAESPHLGQPITEADIAAWAIDIAPDGRGLPPGSGTAAKGEEIYVEKCAVCHGFDVVGTPADALAGGQGTLTFSAGTGLNFTRAAPVAPFSAGTLRTTTPTFVATLIFVILLVAALNFIPALALGPIATELSGSPF